MATKILAGVVAAFLATGVGVYVAFSGPTASGEQADVTLSESSCCSAKAPSCCAATAACCAESQECCPTEALAACTGAAVCTATTKASPHCDHE